MDEMTRQAQDLANDVEGLALMIEDATPGELKAAAAWLIDNRRDRFEYRPHFRRRVGLLARLLLAEANSVHVGPEMIAPATSETEWLDRETA